MNTHQLPFTLFFCFLLFGTVHADLMTSWDIGEKPDDFSAFRIDESTGNQETVNWKDEFGADVYVVSTCAMWCGPCQQYAVDSQLLVQTMEAEGIEVKVYDFIFQDNNFLEPDASDAQAWIDALWSDDPENVWFGDAISTSANESVTIDIFEALENAGKGSASAPGIPGIAILDRNMIVRDLQAGYVPNRIADAVRLAAVPEPNSAILLTVGFLIIGVRHRRNTAPQHLSNAGVPTTTPYPSI